MGKKYCMVGQRMFTRFVNEEVKLVKLARAKNVIAKQVASAKADLKLAKDNWNDHADQCDICTPD